MDALPGLFQGFARRPEVRPAATASAREFLWPARLARPEQVARPAAETPGSSGADECPLLPKRIALLGPLSGSRGVLPGRLTRDDESRLEMSRNHADPGKCRGEDDFDRIPLAPGLCGEAF